MIFFQRHFYSIISVNDALITILIVCELRDIMQLIVIMLVQMMNMHASGKVLIILNSKKTKI